MATLNIGVSDETACISEKKYPVFAAKLVQDLNLFISHGVQIICLQEVNQSEIIGLAKTVLSQWGSKHGFDFKVFGSD